MRKVTLPKDSSPRRTADAGERAQGHGQRHDDVAGAARRVDYGAHSWVRDAAAAPAFRQSNRISAARSRSASSSRSIAPMRAARRATPGWIRRALRWRAST